MTDSNENKAKRRLETLNTRYSLRELMVEVEEERRDSVHGRELVDADEIEKMFKKRIIRKKR